MSPDFDTEYETHLGFVIGFVRKRIGTTPEVEDVVQETFARLFVRLRKGVDENWHTQKWLCVVVARNLCVDENRRRQTRVLSEAETVMSDDEGGVLDAPFLSLETTEGLPEREFEVGEIRDRMRQATDCLTDQDRTVLAMRELYGLSYDQMAARLGKHPSAIETALWRARHKFSRRYRALQAAF